MEESILKLNDLISKKETETYSITGTTIDGTFRCTVEPEAHYKENVTHFVYLKSFTGWSYFPNLDTSNNKFIYSNPAGAKKEITFQTGSYQIEDYNNMVYINMLLNGDKGIPDNKLKRFKAEIKDDPNDEHAISIFPYIPTSRIMIRIKQGYKVHFEKSTWFKELGFKENAILEHGLHTAPNRADLMKTLKVRIECDICNGFKINRSNKSVARSSNVLYEFPNNTATGDSISINPNPVIYTTLLRKRFSEITLKFVDDDGKLVNFQGEEFNCVIVITQSRA
jgi:hypothetical protein